MRTPSLCQADIALYDIDPVRLDDSYRMISNLNEKYKANAKITATLDRAEALKGAKYIVLAEPEEDNENLLCPLCGKLVMKPECSFCKIDFDTSRRQTAKNS